MTTTLEKRFDEHVVQRRLGNGSVDIRVATHRCPTARSIIVNYPGFRGEIGGFNDKYVKIANDIVGREIAAVVRMANVKYQDLEYGMSVIDDLYTVIDFTLRQAHRLCATHDPELYLMGFSAGAGSVAAVSPDYREIKKLLLVAPSLDATRAEVESGLGAFEGDVYVAIGDKDSVVGPQAGQLFYDMATKARSRKLVVVKNCDHQFRGTENGKILSNAPLWAFADDQTFPSPDGGIELY